MNMLRPYFISLRAEDLAGLSLKARKCVIVPVGTDNLEAFAAKWRPWLASFCPVWQLFDIRSWVRYLGFAIGPQGRTNRFDDIYTKVATRVGAISRAYSFAQVSGHSYNLYASTMLSYICQPDSLPWKFYRIEPFLLESLLKVPHGSYGVDGLFRLFEVGLRSFASLEALNLACLARTANATLRDWRVWLDLLRKIAEGDVSNLGDTSTLADPSVVDSLVGNRSLAA